MYDLNVSITWDPPDEINGELSGYTVTVFRTDNSTDIIFSVENVTETNISRTIRVLFYTNYTVSVTAVTGGGELEGEAEEIVFLSPEAGKTAWSYRAVHKSPTYMYMYIRTCMYNT